MPGFSSCQADSEHVCIHPGLQLNGLVGLLSPDRHGTAQPWCDLARRRLHVTQNPTRRPAAAWPGSAPQLDATALSDPGDAHNALGRRSMIYVNKHYIVYIPTKAEFIESKIL